MARAFTAGVYSNSVLPNSGGKSVYFPFYNLPTNELYAGEEATKKVLSFKNGDVTDVPSVVTSFTPYSVFTDGSGKKFVVGNSRNVRMFTTSGSVSTLAAIPYISYGVNAITGDTSGNLFVTENAQIYKISSTTGAISTFTGTGAPGTTTVETDAAVAQVSAPVGISVDPESGNVFFALFNSNRIQMVRASDNKLVPLAGGKNPIFSAIFKDFPLL